MNTIDKQKSGFTIIEVVITTILVLLMSLPLANISFSSVRNTQYAKQAGEALAIGQEKLEELESLAYGSVAAGSSTDDVYRLGWIVDEISQTWGTTAGACKIVTLTVSWNIGGSSKASSVEVIATYPEPSGNGYFINL